MKTMHTIMTHIKLGSNAYEIESDPGTDEEKTARIINILFQEMSIIFPAMKFAWKPGHEFNQAKRIWTQIFINEGLMDLNKINHGLAQFGKMLSPFVPTPGQFIAMCNSFDEGRFIQKEKAYKLAYEIMRTGETKNLTDEQSMVILHAINESDRYFLKNNNIDKTQAVFYRNYEISIRDYLEGRLKPIPKALDDTQKGNTTKRSGNKEEMSKIKQLLGMK